MIRAERPPAAAETLGERAYGRTYNGLLEGARRVTLVTQSGSLPVYLAVIFCVIVLVLGVALAQGAGDNGGNPVLADSVLQAAVALLATITSLAVVMARRRFVSVLLLGGVGQALTVLFLMYGAPDLALTQFMIETLMIVAFVLVLRHLPETYSAPPSWAPLGLRIGLAVAVGVTVAGFALAAGGGDRPTDVTDTIERLSLPEAGGKNVVNVTIVDFRGIDTMGEITVFGIAALGVANLVTASRRGAGQVETTRFARIGAESMIFEQVTRMIFHITLLVSLYIALRGHNAPGGGFAGGLIAGAAFVFRLLAGGTAGRTVVARLSPGRADLARDAVRHRKRAHVADPRAASSSRRASSTSSSRSIGDVKLVSAAVFDLGVYLLVIGVVIIVLSHLSSRTHSGDADARGGVDAREPRPRAADRRAVRHRHVLDDAPQPHAHHRRRRAHRQRRQPAAHRRRQPPGVPPIVGKLTGSTDPIPQALVLTAIVIGFALQAFLLALAWRSWTLDGNDDVEDDLEDMLLAAERRRYIRQDEAARRAERERLLSGDDGPLLSGPRKRISRPED